MKNIIAISGKSGCGNSTISIRLEAIYGYKRINYTFRDLANKYNIEFEELLAKAKNDESFDKELDAQQFFLARKGNTILASRLAIWLMKDEAITIYLDGSLDKRIDNIAKREKNKSIEELRKFNDQRDMNDHDRFLKTYGIDNDNFQFADVIIKIDGKEIEQIVCEIENKIGEIMNEENRPTTAST